MSAAAQTLSIPDAVKLALEHCDAGRLPKAEQIYRQILESRPGDVDVLHLLGVIARRVGKAADAVALIARAHPTHISVMRHNLVIHQCPQLARSGHPV